MMTLYKSNDRGLTQLNWLTSYHSFSFGDYHNPQRLGSGPLRVINEDFIAPGTGFATHSHHHMEIITYVIEGEIAHQDSLGNGSTIRPGEIQRMSAGTGIRHSEHNHSKVHPLHLLQIWIVPNTHDLQPSYEQKKFVKMPNQLTLIGSESGSDEAVTIHQNVKLFVGYLEPEQTIDYPVKSTSLLWIQLIKGHIQVNDLSLQAGDGLDIFEENQIKITCIKNSEFLFFDFQN